MTDVTLSTLSMTPAAGQPQGYQIVAEGGNDQAGISVSAAGDFNNDGNEDYLIGARGSLGSGVAYLVLGQGTPIAGNELALSALTGPNGFQMTGAAAGDQAGMSVSAAGDVNGDGLADLAVGAPYADASAGAAYVVFGKSSGLGDLNLGALGADGFRLFAGAGDYTGISVSDAGDVNGDGFGDLLVGARGYNLGEGAAFVVYGKATGLTGDIDLVAMASTVGVRITGEGANNTAAGSVSSAGDVNGDGIDDLIVGDLNADGENAGSGAAYLVYGQTGGFGGNIDLGSLGGLGVKLNGESLGDRAGLSVSSAGDVNADGFDDLIVGATDADSSSGGAYVVFGSGALGATIDLADLDGNTGFRVTAPRDLAGVSVSSAGDVNGDGYADLIVGAPAQFVPGGAGLAYVVFGKASGFAATLDMTSIASPDGFRIVGEETTDLGAYSVSSAGDINGDGYDDLMVGAPYFGGDDRGAGYVIFGSPTIGGSVDSVDYDGNIFADFNGNTAADETWVGGRANDHFAIIGGAFVGGGADVMHGGQGNDLMEVPDLAFLLADGGTGSDTLFFTAGVTMVDTDFRKLQEMETVRLGNAAFDITLGQNADRAFSGRSLTIDGILVTNSAVSIDGADMLQNLSADFRNNAASMVLHGGDGSDTLRGGAGADDIGGGSGADSLIGGHGLDEFEVTDGDIVADLARNAEGLFVDGLMSTALSVAMVGDDTVLTIGGTVDVTLEGQPYALAGFAAQDTGTGVLVTYSQPAGDLFLSDIGNGTRGFVMYGSGGFNFDQAGFSVGTAGDVDGDGFDDILVGTGGGYLGGGGYYNAPGIAYLINGKASGHGAIELEDIDAGGGGDGGSYLYGGAHYAGAGYTASGVGDINGDGFQDFALGSPNAQTPFTGYYAYDGRAWIVFGDGGGVPDTDLATLAAPDGFTVHGVYNAAYELGWTATGGGDLNGDGFDEVLISSTYALESGETFVIFGGSGPFADIDRASGTPSAAWTFTGGAGDSVNGSRGKMSATGGDIDGDGFDDLILGYRSASENGDVTNGRVEVWLGGNGAPTSGGTLTGGANGDEAGQVVANLGDLNADGFDDIGVSAPSIVAAAEGASYVVFGKAGGVGSVDLSSLTDGFAVTGAAANDHLATALSSAGDVNGDGYDDVILSSWFADGGAGEAYVLFGQAGATNSFADVDLATLDIARGFRISAESAGDLMGGAVSSAGDLDGDGYDDLLIGAQSAESSTGLASGGRAYVLFGSDTIAGATSAVTHQGTSAGESLIGTGADEVMIGGQGADTIVGGGGQDVMRGGEGDDLLYVVDNSFRRIDGGTGQNTLALSNLTLADTDFLRVADVARLQLQSGSSNLALGAIASNALDGRSVVVEGLSGISGATINGSALDEMLDADFGAANAAVVLLGGSAGDNLTGGTGSDALMGGAGADSLDGGGGKDRALYNLALAAVTVDLMEINGAAGEAVGDDLDNIEDLVGSGFNDSLYGADSEANALFGLGGHDSLDGRTGADLLVGGLGDDTLVGGAGMDTASYADATGSVTVDLSNLLGQNTGASGTDRLDGIEHLLGSAQSDTLTGDGAANDLNGAGGGDALHGGALGDTLRGGAGDDTLDGGAGEDFLAGGAGDFDIADYSGITGDLVFSLKTMTGTAEGDDDALAQIEGARGGAGGDSFKGNGGDNLFYGEGGDDTMIGGLGNDTMNGGAGVDRMNGGNGRDIYVFDAGEADGDEIVGFDGNGPAARDELIFFGYGNDGTFTDLGGGIWEIANAARTIVEEIDLGVGTTVDASDYAFDPI